MAVEPNDIAGAAIMPQIDRSAASSDRDTRLASLWIIVGPLVLSGSCVWIAVVIQRHLGILLSSGASIELLVGVGAAGFLVGQAIAAVSQSGATARVRIPRLNLRSIAECAGQAAMMSALPIMFAMAAYGLYRALPHYEDPAYNAFMRWVDVLVLVYTFGAFPYYFVTLLVGKDSRAFGVRVAPPESLIVVRTVQSVRRASIQPLLRIWRHRRVRSSALSLPLRFFFIPLMFSSVMGMRMHLMLHIALIEDAPGGTAFVFRWLLPFVSKVCLFLDVLIATAAYMIESKWLGNRIRSTDRNVSGWIVCLICYFPFHVYLDGLLPGTSQPPAAWAGTPLAQHALQIAILISQVLWLLPTLCLGFRASNLTHRGIVRFGPFRWIRHPQYAFHLMFLLLVLVPRFQFPGAVVTTLVMIGIYVARCVTEERHLSADPVYRSYCRETRYRLLPGIW